MLFVMFYEGHSRHHDAASQACAERISPVSDTSKPHLRPCGCRYLAANARARSSKSLALFGCILSRSRSTPNRSLAACRSASSTSLQGLREGFLTRHSTLLPCLRNKMRQKHRSSGMSWNSHAVLRSAAPTLPRHPAATSSKRFWNYRATGDGAVHILFTGQQEGALLLPQLLRHWVVHGALVHHSELALVLKQLLARDILFLSRTGTISALHHCTGS